MVPYTICPSENSFGSTSYTLGLSSLINVIIVYHFYYYIGFHWMAIPKALVWLFMLFQGFIIVNAVLLQQNKWWYKQSFYTFSLVHLWKTLCHALWAIWYGGQSMHTFSSIRYCQITIQSGCNNLHFQEQYMRIPISLHSYQHCYWKSLYNCLL